MSRIRVITPIISSGFRDDSPLLATVPDGCTLSAVFLDKGPASVESAVDEVLAAPGVVDAALRAEAENIDALIIDCMLDPGLDAAREAVSIPVIGCGEAGLKAAARSGRFSVITVLDRQARAFRDLAARHGLAGQLASVRGIGVSVLDLERDRDNSVAATIREARKAVLDDGARAVVFGCTGMLGFGAPVAEDLGDLLDQVIDPLPHAIAVAHAAVLANEKTDKSKYPAPEPKDVRGFSDWVALSAHLKGKS